MAHLTEWCYGWYLTLSVALTVWVARTLFKNGRIFLVDAFRGKDRKSTLLNSSH